MYRNNYYNNYRRNGYQNDQYRGKPKPPPTPVESFKNNTEQTKKAYLIPYVFEALDKVEQAPKQAYFVNSTGAQQIYYFLCPLPFNFFAIYSQGRVCVCEGYTPDGRLKFLSGVYYDIEVRNFIPLPSGQKSVWEDEFVESVRSYVRTFHPLAL